MIDIVSTGKAVVKDIVDTLGRRADAVSDRNGETDAGNRNAIGHSYTSALLDYNNGALIAESFGDLKEAAHRAAADIPALNVNYDERDGWKDQWNNEVGRRIAEYAKQHGLSESALDDLIIDALNNGELIEFEEDGRINLNNPPSPTWNTPSNSWSGSSAGDAPDNSPIPGFIPPPGPDGGNGGGAGGSGGSGGSGGNWWDPITGPLRDFFDFPPVSPLIIDFDKDGLIELTPLTDSSGSFFDLDADGFVEQTGWVKADDALLARDLNGNGVIDNINELFGNDTTDGFIVLDALDSNNDNIISSADAAFGSLLVWRDLDGDAYSDAGELQSLTAAGIASIDLNYTALSNVKNQGHDVSSQSTVTLADATTVTI